MWVVLYVHPTTNGGVQNGSSFGIYTHCTYVFAHLVPICMLSRCLLTKFLRRSSVGSSLRARCWLGMYYQPSNQMCWLPPHKWAQSTHSDWNMAHSLTPKRQKCHTEFELLLVFLEREFVTHPTRHAPCPVGTYLDASGIRTRLVF